MHVAALDLGTNTFHLLIGRIESGVCVYVHRTRCRVMLGREGMASGQISKAAFGRAKEAIRELKAIWTSWQVSHVWVAATSAFREATNGHELLKALQSEAHISARVLSGKEEARLIGEGVQAALTKTDISSYLVMDIGGGSTEFILASKGETHGLYSYEIGAQRLYERFSKEDPLSSQTQRALSAYLTPILADLLQLVAQHKPKHLIGTSGTFNTLYDVYAAQSGAPSRRSKAQWIFPIPKPFFEQTTQRFITSSYAERLAMAGIPYERARLIPFGGFLIQWICTRYHFAHQHLCTFALKEGLITQGIQTLT